MNRLSLLAFFFIFTACNGGGSTTALLPSGVITSSEELRSNSALSEAQSNALPHPQPAYTPGVNDLLYVGNVGSNSITVYKHDAQGNTAPLIIIGGSKTGISSPGNLSEDAQGDLYVANALKPAAILVFAHGAHGNIEPIRKITGTRTGLHGVNAMTVDQTTGKIFAWDGIYDDYESICDEAEEFFLIRFAPNANGNTAPFARSAPLCASAVQMSSDSTGQNLIVAQGYSGPSYVDIGIEIMAKQFANNTTPTALKFIDGPVKQGIADDPATKTFLLGGGEVTRLSEAVTGSFVPIDNIKPAPIVITNSCSGQLALGYLRNIYTTCGNAVYVYPHDASGKVAPLRILSGSATKLNEPFGIYEGQ